MDRRCPGGVVSGVFWGLGQALAQVWSGEFLLGFGLRVWCSPVKRKASKGLVDEEDAIG